jgi:hypothetical protein
VWNNLYELFFCPIHGLLAPRNWPILFHSYSMARPHIFFWRKR